MNVRRWLLISLLILCAGLMAWAQYRYLAYPIRYTRRDFMSLWGGGRALLERLDPYEPADWLPLRARYGSTWMPDERAPYPLWTLALMMPFSALDVDWGAAWWLVFSEGLLGASVYLLASEVGQARPSPTVFMLLLVGGFATRGTLVTLYGGQITIVLLFVVTLFLVLMVRERPLLAGLVLALTALKPNPFLLLVPLLGVWLLWRRQWRAVLGAGAGGVLLLVATWAIQPGWPVEWLAVRSKTAATFKTPTVWGLAHALSEEGWPVLGLVTAGAVTAAVGWIVFHHRDWRAPKVTALGVAGSLLVTPYAWAYEHALLLVPLVLLFARTRRDWVRWSLWGGLAVALPWALYWAAMQSDSDVMSALVPASAGVACLLCLPSVPTARVEV